MAKQKISQTELARRLGVTRSAVSVWLGTKMDLSEHNETMVQYKIASVLGVSQDYLATGISRETPTGRAVPLLDDAAVADYVLQQITPENTPWIYCPEECSELTFCIVTRGSSMDSTGTSAINIPLQAKIFIDPKVSLELGNICLFNDTAPVLGSYEELNGKSILVLANPRFTPVDVVRDNYLGTVVGMYQSLKK
ncbi:helix-turn-helix domain-containing protein [Endozoicomonas sp. SCSIO W0465]|uniref:helix-turn-helix domain-containing protein n=1 Tax=Endozoicomonas sp. SCSIO W0465 TaxID=2918516 RepID=UPI002076331F|nr:helix-turn-helix transcriptional regulator [Endozoicomonas sp. SCSIO W0465]USE34110.1 helix-turn-helix transcriptional regulator [Endozoicomonas sp. SCSIO W0465]